MKLVVYVVVLLVIPSHAWKSAIVGVSRPTTKLSIPIVYSNAIWNSYYYSKHNQSVGRCFMTNSNNRNEDDGNNNKNILFHREVDLKSELTRYLQVRSERGEEEDVNQEPIIIGGTRGNIILDYVSGSPNKEMIITEKPNIFDYTELEKYGFGVRIIKKPEKRVSLFFYLPSSSQ